MTERSSRCGKPSESPGWWNRGGARPVNGLRRADRTARPSRDRRVSHPLSIGARMMVRVSERTCYNVNLGGIAETAVFVPWRGKGFLFWPCPNLVNTPRRRTFFRRASLVCLAIHKGFPRQTALPDEKIPRRRSCLQGLNKASCLKPPPGPWHGPGHLPSKQHQRRIYP